MKTILRISILLLVVILASVACQEEEVLEQVKVDNELLALVGDEIIDDNNFTELLLLGDDGLFWDENAFNPLKSGDTPDKGTGTCPEKDIKRGKNKKIVINTFSGDCNKSGMITIIYSVPNDKKAAQKKTIIYDEFTKNGIIYNGEKQIVKDKNVFSIKAEMSIEKVNDDGEKVSIVRNYQRQVNWICGLRTKKKTDDIFKVTGKSEVKKIVGDKKSKFTRKIVKPLIVAKKCDLKIQAGVVKIVKGNGNEIKINYGERPEKISCKDEFACDNTFEVTKDGETYQMVLEEGERVKVKE